jgi:hypothetical protein
MNYYDYIFIGASISNLLASTTLKNKQILIIEKDNYIGGAWRIDTEYYKNMDLVGHLIIPRNDIIGNKIIEYFKNINLELEYINKTDFLFESESYRSNNKEGTPIISKYGWTEFFCKIYQYVKTFNTIKIIKNIEILKINCQKEKIILKSINNYFHCNKLVIPMYCNINKINYNNTFLEIPYKLIVNTHVLLKIKFETSLHISKNYQAFLDKYPIGVFDRVTVSKISHNDCILSCRISKNFKNQKNIEKLFLPFLKEKKILNDFCEIKEVYYYNYNCYYRDPEYSRECFTNNCIKINTFYGINRIFTLNTIYMGHFLEDLIENRLNIT